METSIATLKRERAEKIKDLQSLVDTAEGESRDFNDDENTRYERLKKEIEALERRIKRAEEQERLNREAAEEERVARPKAGDADYTPKVEVGETRMEKDPKRGFKSPHEFLTVVASASRGDTLAPRHREALSMLEQRTAGSDEQGTYANPYGGFLVPEGFIPQLYRVGAEGDPIGSRVTNIPLGATSVSIPARVDKNHSSSVSGGLTVARSVETQAKTSSRMSFELINLKVDSLFGLTYVTEEMLSDSAISLVPIIEQGFGDEFASKLIDERINGTGVGEFLGILNSDALVSVSKETGQAADTIVYDNIVKMRKRCWNYSNAIWLYNHDCLDRLMNLVLPIGTAGVPMWQASAREGEPDMLLGRPAIATEYCNTIGDKGDIILADWSQYLEGTYQPLQSGESIHVRFEYHERTFKFWMRNAGAPWWRSALTPKNSTSTLSPFVALNARA